MKHKNRLKISFGHKHEWIDTQGHTHHVVFDEKILEKPRATWVVLAVVTFFAIAVGLVGVLTAKRDGNGGGSVRMNSTAAFEYKYALAPDTGDLPCAIAAGWNDELFAVDKHAVKLYDGDGVLVNSWTSETEKEPTAMTFVSNENDPRDGLLIVAYGDELRVLRFKQDNVVTDEAGAVHFTAQDGAEGSPELLAVLPNLKIGSLEVAGDRLFAADLNSSRVFRYSWKKFETLAEAGDKTILPDCVIGEPDFSTGYAGLETVDGKGLSMAYIAAENELFVVNLGASRVDVFNANTGVFKLDRKILEVKHQGAGAQAFPRLTLENAGLGGIVAAYDAAVNEEIVAVYTSRGETTSKTLVSKDRREAPGEISAVASSVDSTRVYALCSDGNIDVWEVAK